MGDNKTDIEQIRKYLNGELNAHAMHQLERQAQHDPFLWDVLKGMESGNENHQVNLNDIDKLIQQRVEKDRRVVVPMWKMASVAASLLIALGVGGWLFTNHQSEQPKITQTIPKVNHTDKVKVDTQVMSKPAADKPLLAQVRRTQPSPTVVSTPNASVEANDVPAAQYQSHIDTSLFVRKTAMADTGKNGAVLKSVSIRGAAQASLAAKNVTPSAKSDYLKYKSENADTAINRLLSQVPPNVTLQGRLNEKNYKKDTTTFNRNLSAKVAGVQVTTPDLKSREYMQRVTGHVFDQDSHEGLPGVSVKVAGDQIATQTDAAGKFTITVPKGKETLNIGYVGYNNKQVKITDKDSVNVTLAPSAAQLSEVVVTGYGTVKKDEDAEASVEDAHPAIGWKAYNKYLKAGATMSDGRIGAIKLSFTVGANGAISHIKIVKGLTYDMNQKAIQLIQNGPVWVAAGDHQPQIVSQKIRFHK